MSIKRKYISIDAQSKESLQEVRLINQNNVLHAQEVRLTNPETQQMDDIRNIFFSKEDGHQIAETIKESVKEELQGEYITSQDADSRFVSKEDAEDFALKSELEGLASEDQVQATVQAAMEEVEETYLKKVTAEQLATKEDVQEAIDDVKSLVEQTYLKKEDAQQLATKEELQSAEQSIESSIQQTYLSIEDASRTYLSQTAAASLASKSEVASAKQEVLGQVDGTYAKKGDVQDIVKKADFSEIAKIDTDSEYTLADVAAKINEILAAVRSTSGGGGEDEGGQGGGNEPTVNPDPGQGGGTEGGEGTGGNDEPQPETPTEPEESTSEYPTPPNGVVLYQTNNSLGEWLQKQSTSTNGIFDNFSLGDEVIKYIIPPNDKDGNPITAIRRHSQNYEYSLQANVTQVIIPDTTIELGQTVFQGYGKLTTINLPNGLTTIGDGAFRGCSRLEGIGIPNTVTIIGGVAFDGCSSSAFKDLTIPDSVQRIDNSAFYNCSGLERVFIGSGLTSVGSGAFSGCSQLEGVYITDLAAWCGITFNVELGNTGNPLTVAHNLYLNNVLQTNMVIPNGVTTILDYAFDGCTSLVTVTIPSSVTTVWNKVFNGCSNLQTIIVKGKSQSDAEYLLHNANVPNGCQIIGEQEEPTTDPERVSFKAFANGLIIMPQLCEFALPQSIIIQKYSFVSILIYAAAHNYLYLKGQVSLSESLKIMETGSCRIVKINPY